MKLYRVRYERYGCIGAATCVAANPEKWSIKESGDLKADLLDSDEIESDKGVFEKIITEEDLKKMMDAAQGCPASVIHVYDFETGEKLI